MCDPSILRFRADDRKRAHGFPFFAYIIVDWSNGKITEYQDFRFRAPWESVNFEQPVGVFPHKAIAEMSRSEYLQARAKLLESYDALLDAIAQDRSLSSEWESDFKQKLCTLAEPALKPFYSALAPTFYSQFMV